jgi:hypothetical protein
MPLRWEPYAAQQPHWPEAGRCILAQHDDDTVVVYQAFRPAIADHAVAHQRLDGGGFSLARMSWIKPNFLWMMYRCGWATKPDQERVVAVTLQRAGFESLLAAAVASSWDRAQFATQAEWEAAVKRSDVRVQWDPDHGPGGAALARRAVQLGLRGEALRRYVYAWTVGIEDITAAVRDAHAAWRAGGDAALSTPVERVFHPRDAGSAPRG